MTEPDEKKEEKSPINEQIAGLIVKVLMTGGVSAGGLGAFWSLFKESDVPKAIASAVIGIGITYGASLLSPVHEGTQRRLKKVGEAIDGSIDSNIDQLFAKVSGAEEAYLLCQALDCRDYKSEGMGKRDRIMTPILEEVFVPLELNSSAVPIGFQVSERMQFQQRQSIWDFLQHSQKQPAYRQLAIVAWGGFGKTTLLKHLAYMYGTRKHKQFGVPHLIPVLLPLRQYRKQIAQENPPSLPELVMQHHVKQLAEIDAKHDRLSKLEPNWFRDVLADGKALVMMDGFDEIPDSERSAFGKWIQQQMRRFDKSVFILTSRPAAYKEMFEESGLIDPLRTKIWVRRLTAEQQTRFVHQWYFCQEKLDRGGRDTPEVEREASRNAENLLMQIRDRQRPELGDLAKNPLLLTLLATYHRSDPGVELPRQRAELYQDICSLQLRKRPAARDVVLPLSPDDRQAILQSVALEMMQRHTKLIDETELIQLIRTALATKDYPDVSAQIFLQQIVEVSELIVKQGLEGYEFSHLSFQEFLAAKQIKDLHQEALLYEFLKDSDVAEDGDNRAWWRQTILLYAAQTNPTRLIKEAIAQKATNLASACYQENRRVLPMEIQKELRIEQELGIIQAQQDLEIDQRVEILQSYEQELKFLQSQLRDLKYAGLKELLRAGEWEEADKETYRLLITTIGKEEGQFFDLEDIETFPCQDLLKIDKLWVEASNGHFGFSVQTKIWKECGSVTSDALDDWEKFGDRVGWRRDGNWLSYSDLHKNPSLSPIGELPVEGEGGMRWRGWFFSRIKTCDL